MRDGDWKLILTHQEDSAVISLFNLKNDIREKYNLTLEQTERVRSMKLAIENWKKDVKKGATVQPE